MEQGQRYKANRLHNSKDKGLRFRILDCGIQKTKKEKMRVKGPRFKEKGQRLKCSMEKRIQEAFERACAGRIMQFASGLLN